MKHLCCTCARCIDITSRFSKPLCELPTLKRQSLLVAHWVTSQMQGKRAGVR